jgi:translation initiation factor IF-1
VDRAAIRGRTIAGKQIVRTRSERVVCVNCRPFDSCIVSNRTPDRPSDDQKRIAGQGLTQIIQERFINLPKEDAIEVTGRVVEKFKAGMFSIELEAGRGVLATMAGRLRRNRIKIMNGDRVTLELSPYDLTKGRITYRHK